MIYKEFDTCEEAEKYAQENLNDGEYDIMPAYHPEEEVWDFAILVPDEEDLD